MVTLSGLCIRQITSDFLIYPLKDVENDIQRHYTSSGGTNSLPKLPSAVGGEIHLMIGVKYLRYHPKPVHQLPTSFWTHVVSILLLQSKWRAWCCGWTPQSIYWCSQEFLQYIKYINLPQQPMWYLQKRIFSTNRCATPWLWRGSSFSQWDHRTLTSPPVKIAKSVWISRINWYRNQL